MVLMKHLHLKEHHALLPACSNGRPPLPACSEREHAKHMLSPSTHHLRVVRSQVALQVLAVGL
eukprot:364965-Chlamydomonas_euryale.AAC.10